MRTVAKFGLTLVAALALTVAVPLGAKADPIGGEDCETCFGVVYTLLYDPNPISTGAGVETFQVFLTLDTSGYNGEGSFLNAVAIKVASSSDFVTATLVGAPAGFSGGPGGLAGNGCTASDPGFACAEFNTNAGVPVPDGIYTFVFNVTVATGTLFTDPFQASVKALYVTGGTDNQGEPISRGLTSENVSLQVIPEPATMILFGSGLLATAGALKRRLKR